MTCEAVKTTGPGKGDKIDLVGVKGREWHLHVVVVTAGDVRVRPGRVEERPLQPEILERGVLLGRGGQGPLRLRADGPHELLVPRGHCWVVVQRDVAKGYLGAGRAQSSPRGGGSRRGRGLLAAGGGSRLEFDRLALVHRDKVFVGQLVTHYAAAGAGTRKPCCRSVCGIHRVVGIGGGL